MAEEVKTTKKTEIELKVDAEKMKKIEECLKKGKLVITVDDADLAGTKERATGAYQYD